MLLRAPSSSGDDTKVVLFKNLVPFAEKQLFGEFRSLWPLTKILDIGGAPVKPRLSLPACFHPVEITTGEHESSAGEYESEVPPIPAHVHSGDIVDGKATGHGKKEVGFACSVCFMISLCCFIGLFLSTARCPSVQCWSTIQWHYHTSWYVANPNTNVCMVVDDCELGLKPSTTIREVEHCLDHFGFDDSFCTCLLVFPVLVIVCLGVHRGACLCAQMV